LCTVCYAIVFFQKIAELQITLQNPEGEGGGNRGRM